MKSALAIGGASALSTALGVAGVPETAAAREDHDPISFTARDNRQHAWDGYEKYFPAREQTLPPEHHLLLHVDYVGDGAPSDADRQTAAEAFREIERNFQWGHEGVLFTVGYSASYFDRFDESLPAGIGPATDVEFAKPALLRPQTLIDFPGVTLERERPVAADTNDAVIHLASDDIRKLLLVEQLLWNEYDPERVWDEEPASADVTFDATLDGIFTKPESYPERRVGFAGHENVETRLDEDTDFDADRVPSEDEFAEEVGEHPPSELSMGFNDQYKNSLPRETNVTLLEDQRLGVAKPPGSFAQGTIQHVSKLNIDLERFYDENDRKERRARMFSPDHDDKNAGAVGENLGNSNAPGDTPMRDVTQAPDDPTGGDKARETEPDWEEQGVAGHAQKTARARFDMETRITDDGQERLSGGDRDELLPAEERPDDLPGHDGEQETEGVLLRRDFVGTAPAAPDEDRTPGNHFVALMRFNPYMAYMRQAMNGVPFDSGAGFGLDGDGRIEHGETGAEFASDGTLEDVSPDSGIANYLETQRRGNYLVPPLTKRALPHPQSEPVEISVERAGENYRVTVEGVAAEDLAEGSVRFGWFYDVNRGGGASPRQARQRGNRTTYVFPADETGIGSAPGGPDGDVRVRLFAKRADTGRPVRGTARVDPEGSRGNETAGREGDGRGR